MPCCTAPRCGNNSSTSKGIAFHSFPLSRPHMVERWLECLQAQGKKHNWRPNHWSKVCGRHFEERYILRLSQVRLTDDAVPTIFDPLPEVKILRTQKSRKELLHLETMPSDNTMSEANKTPQKTHINPQVIKMSSCDKVPKLIALDSPEVLRARQDLQHQRSNIFESVAVLNEQNLIKSANCSQNSNNCGSDDSLTEEKNFSLKPRGIKVLHIQELKKNDFSAIQIDCKKSENRELQEAKVSERLENDVCSQQLRRLIRQQPVNPNLIHVIPMQPYSYQPKFSQNISTHLDNNHMIHPINISNSLIQDSNSIPIIETSQNTNDLDGVFLSKLQQINPVFQHSAVQVTVNESFGNVKQFRQGIIKRLETRELKGSKYTNSNIPLSNDVQFRENTGGSNTSQTSSGSNYQQHQQGHHSNNGYYGSTSYNPYNRNYHQQHYQRQDPRFQQYGNYSIPRYRPPYSVHQNNEIKSNTVQQRTKIGTFNERSPDTNVQQPSFHATSYPNLVHCVVNSNIKNQNQILSSNIPTVINKTENLTVPTLSTPVKITFTPAMHNANSCVPEKDNTQKPELKKSTDVIRKDTIDNKLHLIAVKKQEISKPNKPEENKKKESEQNDTEKRNQSSVSEETKKKSNNTSKQNMEDKNQDTKNRIGTNSLQKSESKNLQAKNNSSATEPVVTYDSETAIYGCTSANTGKILHTSESSKLKIVLTEGQNTQNSKKACEIGKEKVIKDRVSNKDSSSIQLQSPKEISKYSFEKNKNNNSEIICTYQKERNKLRRLSESSISSHSKRNSKSSETKNINHKIKNHTDTSKYQEDTKIGSKFVDIYEFQASDHSPTIENNSLNKKKLQTFENEKYKKKCKHSSKTTSSIRKPEKQRALENSTKGRNSTAREKEIVAKDQPAKCSRKNDSRISSSNIRNKNCIKNPQEGSHNRRELNDKKENELKPDKIIKSQGNQNLHKSVQKSTLKEKGQRKKEYSTSSKDKRNPLKHDVFDQSKGTDLCLTLRKPEENVEEIKNNLAKEEIKGFGNAKNNVPVKRVYSPDSQLQRKAKSERRASESDEINRSELRSRSVDIGEILIGRKPYNPQSKFDQQENLHQQTSSKPIKDPEKTTANVYYKVFLKNQTELVISRKQETFLERKAICQKPTAFTNESKTKHKATRRKRSKSVDIRRESEKVPGIEYKQLCSNITNEAYLAKNNKETIQLKEVSSKKKTRSLSNISEDEEHQKHRRSRSRNKSIDEDYKPPSYLPKRSRGRSVPPETRYKASKQSNRQSNKITELKDDSIIAVTSGFFSANKNELRALNKNKCLSEKRTNNQDSTISVRKKFKTIDGVEEKSKREKTEISSNCTKITAIVQPAKRTKSCPPILNCFSYQEELILYPPAVSKALTALCTKDSIDINKGTRISSENASKTTNELISSRSRLSAEFLTKSLKFRMQCLVWLLLQLKRSNITFSSPVIHEAGVGDAFIQYQNLSGENQKLFFFPRFRGSNVNVSFSDFFGEYNSNGLFNLKNYYQTFKEVLPSKETRFFIYTNATFEDALFEMNLLGKCYDNTLERVIYYFNTNYKEYEKIIKYLIHEEVIEEEIAKNFYRSLYFIEGTEDVEKLILKQLSEIASTTEAKSLQTALFEWSNNWLSNKSSNINEFENIVLQNAYTEIYGNYHNDMENINIVGKDREISLLHKMFINHTKGPIVISGIAGIGKTFLLKKGMQTYSRDLGTVVWLDASNFEESVISTAEYFKIKHQNSFARAIRGLKYMLRGRLSTIILDNVENSDSLSNDIVEFSTTENPVLIVITSRSNIWNGYQQICLTELNVQESCKLLCEMLDFESQTAAENIKESIIEICEMSNGLPMAIKLAATCIIAGADSFSVLEQSTAISRSICSLRSRIRKLSKEINQKSLTDVFCKGLLLYFEIARRQSIGEQHDDLAGTILELLSSVGVSSTNLKTFLPVVQSTTYNNTNLCISHYANNEEEDELMLAKAAKILVSHGLLKVSDEVARLSHPIIGELTCLSLTEDGRQAQVLDLAFTLSQRKINENNELSFEPHIVWCKALNHLELLIKHHRNYLDFLDTSNEHVKIYKIFASKITTLGSYQSRILSALLWTKLRIARYHWELGHSEEADNIYNKVLKDITHKLDAQDAFFMRSFKLVCCMKQLSKLELLNEIELLLSHSVPMSLGSETRHLKYVHVLAQALGKVGRKYQAWELYEVIWKQLSNVQLADNRECPRMCEVMASAGSLAWGQLADNKVQSTLMACIEESKLQVEVLVGYATWAWSLDNLHTRGIATEIFNQVLLQTTSKNDYFDILIELWHRLCSENLMQAAAKVTEASMTLNTLPWQRSILVIISKLTAYNICEVSLESITKEDILEFLQHAYKLKDWLAVLQEVSKIATSNRHFTLATSSLNKLWELCISPPVLKTITVLPAILISLINVAHKLLDCGRPRDSYQIYCELHKKVQFLVAIGIEELNEILNLLTNMEVSEDSGLMLRTELFKNELSVIVSKLTTPETVTVITNTKAVKKPLITFQSNLVRSNDNSIYILHEPVLSSKESLLLCEKAIKSRSDKNDIESLHLLYHKACILLTLGRLKEAYTTANSVVNILEKLQGYEHNDTISVMFLHASILEVMCRYDDALREYKKVFRIQSKYLGIHDPDRVKTQIRIAAVYESKGYIDSAMEILDALLAQQKQIVGIEHPCTLAVMYEYALLLQKQNKLEESLQAFQQIKNLREEKFGISHLDTIRTLSKIAAVTNLLGNYNKSIDLYNELIDKLEYMLGKNHLLTLSVIQERVMAYQSKKDFKKASADLEQLLELRISSQGLDHPNTLQTMLAIADNLVKLNELDSALELYRNLSEKPSENFCFRINVLNGKAKVYEKQGKLSEAITTLDIVLSSQIPVLGSDHRLSIQTNEKIASLLGMQGKHKEALALYEEISEKAIFILGIDHKKILNMKYNIGVIKANIGNYDEALSIFGELIKSAETYDLKQYLCLKENIASILELKGEFVKSQQIYEEVIETKLMVLADDDPTTIVSLCKLGSVLHKSGLLKEANNIIRKACISTNDNALDDCLGPVFYSSGHFARSLAIFEKSLQEKKAKLGAYHPSTLATLEAKAAALAGCGMKDEALKILNELYLIRCRTSGELNKYALNTKAKMAVILVEQHLLSQALDIFVDVLRTQEKVFGSQHPDTLVTTQNICTVLEMQENYIEALKNYRNLLDNTKLNLGSDHPDIFKLEAKVIKVLGKNGKYEEAYKMYSELVSKIALFEEKGEINFDIQYMYACILDDSGKSNESLDLLKSILQKLKNDHCKISKINFKIAYVLCRTGNVTKGLETLDEVIINLKRNLGEYQTNTIDAMLLRTKLLLQYRSSEDAVIEYGKIVDHLSKKYDEKHELLLLTKGNLAVALEKVGNFKKSLDIFRDILKIQEQVLGSDHPLTLTTKLNYSITLHKHGECVESTQLLLKIAEQGIVRLGSMHHIVSAAKQQTIICLADSGEYKKAIQIYEALKTATKDISTDSLRCVASAYEALHQLNDAVALFEEVKCILEQKFNEMHPSVIYIKSRLASVYQKKGENAKSSQLQREVLEVCRKRLPAKHATTLALAHNYACSLLTYSNDHRKALLEFQRNYKIEKASLGEFHSNTLETRNGMALAMAKCGSLQRARHELVEVLKLQAENMGKEHPNTVSTSHNLATVMEMQGEDELALIQNQEVWEVRRALLGPDNQLTLLSQARVASLLEKLGHHDGQNALVNVLSKQRELLGPNHNDTLATTHALLHSFERKENYNQAMSSCEELIKAYEQTSEGQEEHLSALHHSVWLLEKQGNLPEAAKRCEYLWHTRKKRKGDLDSATLAAKAHLASIYAGQKKLDLAAKTYREVLKDQEETLGRHHPQTLVTLHNLIYVLQREGRSSREVQSLAHTLKLRRVKAQESRSETSLARPCVARETVRLHVELAAIDFDEQDIQRTIPHIVI